MSSDDEKVDVSELKAAERKDATEEGKKQIAEAQQRYMVAEEIEQTPIFQALINSSKNSNISIMLEAIVDRYFDNGGSPIDPSNFTVNQDIILMALRQTIYVISVIENGVVLDENGEIDEEKTAEQREEMRVIVSSGTTEEKKALFSKILDDGERMMEAQRSMGENGAVDKLFMSFELMSMEQITNKMNTKEGQDEKAENMNKLEKDTDEAREDSNLEQANDVKAMKLCQEIVMIATGKTLNSADRNMIIAKMKDLEQYKDGAAKDLLTRKGQISLKKVVAKYQKYEKDYQTKQNTDVLNTLGKQRFSSLSPEDRKKVLESAYMLYHQEGGKYRKDAILALAEIPGVISKQGRQLQLDEKGFTNLYNSLSNDKKNRRPIDLRLEIFAKQRAMVEENTNELIEQIENGTFVAQTAEQRKQKKAEKKKAKAENKEKAQNEEGKSGEEDKSKISEVKEQIKEGISDLKDVATGKKESFFKRLDRRARKNYAKAKMAYAEKKLNAQYSAFSEDMIFPKDEEGNNYELDKVIADELFFAKQEKWDAERQIRMNHRERMLTPEEEKKRIQEIILEPEERAQVVARAKARAIEQAKAQAIVKAYFKSKQEKGENGEPTATTKFMEEYMLSRPAQFGMFIDSDATHTFLSQNKMNAVNFLGSEGHYSEENILQVKDIFKNAKMHEKSFALLVSGSIELAKDAVSTIQRKIMLALPMPKMLTAGSAQRYVDARRLEGIQNVYENGEKKFGMKQPTHQQPKKPMKLFGMNKNLSELSVGAPVNYNHPDAFNEYVQVARDQLVNGPITPTSQVDRLMQQRRLDNFKAECGKWLIGNGYTTQEELDKMPVDAVVRQTIECGGGKLVEDLRGQEGKSGIKELRSGDSEKGMKKLSTGVEFMNDKPAMGEDDGFEH